MAHTLVGVFRDQTEAQSAVDALMDAGFTRGDIHMSSQGGSSMSRMDYDADHDASSETGIGHFFRSLFGMDDDDQTTTRYSSAAERGNCLVCVDVDNDAQTQQAMEVLNRCNPIDIDEDNTTITGTTDAADAMSATGTRTGVETTGRMNAEGGTLEGGARIPVIEEDLQVGKREVQRGGVRIFQRVSERPVDETVQLREEHVNVERRPVNQPASEADFNAFKEGSMELRETAEEAVVAKQARVVEEVVVNKEVSERTEHVHDTVRRTDVEVQNLGTGINSGGTTGTVGSTTTGMTGTTTGPTGLRGTGGYDPDAADVARSDDMLADEPQTDWGGRTDGRPGALDGTPAMATARMTAATNPDASVGASGYPNDESEFRNHWQRAYGNVGNTEGAYEDYAPAYRYGYSMAGNQQYRGQRWEDVEPNLRQDWESNHPGKESTWERMKDAVRHGWDRMTD